MSREIEFTAPTDDGLLAGWLRESPSAQGNALLLHGGPGLNEYLGSLSDELSDLLTTARYQQRGLEPSAVSGSIDIAGHVADATCVMDALDWAEPLVVGHSWGGHLALHLAALQPQRVAALVILDALGPSGDGGAAVFGTRLRAGLAPADRARLEKLEAVDEPTHAQQMESLGIVWPNYFGDPAQAPQMPPLRFSTRSETWQSINANLAAGTLDRLLPMTDVPALVIHGSRSPIPIDQAERIVELMPRARLVVHEGKGHWAWLEEPGFVRRAIEEFMATL